MPSEYTVIPEEGPIDLQQQVKLCSQCQSSVDTNSVFLPDAEAIVCAGCQSQSTVSTRQFPSAPLPSLSVLELPDFSLDTQMSPVRRSLYEQESDSLISLVSESNFHCCSPVSPSSSYTAQPASFDITLSPPRHFPLSTSHPETRSHPFITPSPLTDITRLRVRSQGNHCLYPGAVFQGTQKSGRSSYDVNVTIVVRRSLILLWG